MIRMCDARPAGANDCVGPNSRPLGVVAAAGDCVCALPAVISPAGLGAEAAPGATE